MLPLKAALHCILASFRALQGPGRELQTDEGAFISALYRRLPDLSQSAASGDISRRQVASCVSLVYECLDAALGKRRELSTARVAALVKRLLSVALQLPQVSDALLSHIILELTALVVWTERGLIRDRGKAGDDSSYYSTQYLTSDRPSESRPNSHRVRMSPYAESGNVCWPKMVVSHVWW